MSANLLISEIDSSREVETRYWELRKNTIGASKIPIILGLNKRKSALQLWAEDTGKIKQSKGDDFFAWLGKELEPVVIKLYAKETKAKVRQAKSLYAHESIDWATCSPDAFIFDDVQAYTFDRPSALLEAKTAHYHKAEQWEQSAPNDYYMQVQWQLGVMQMQEAHIACLIGGADFKHYPINFDQDVFLRALDAAEKYRECVISDIPPAAGPGDSKLIDDLVGERVDDTVEINTSQAYALAKKKQATADEIKELKKMIKDLEEVEDLCSNQLKQIIGAHKQAIISDVCEVKLNTIKIAERIQKAYEYTRFNMKWRN